MQRHLLEYVQPSGHTAFLQDNYVTLIDKTDPRAPTKREDYSIDTLKTKATLGLDVESGYWASILYSYCTTISFPGFGQLVLGLFSVYSDYGYIYFIIWDSTSRFLSCEMEFLWQW